jgi:hypothetical protein
MSNGKAALAAKDVPYKWIRGELQFDREYRRGDKAKKVKVLQEWLTLGGEGLKVDGEFGPVEPCGRCGLFLCARHAASLSSGIRFG